MLAVSHRQRPRRAPRAPRPRRGVALVFVMVFVIAMAALAMSSIFMASSSNLLAKSYDRERDLRDAADAALAIGKARINGRPSLLVMPVDTLFRALMKGDTLGGANNTRLGGIRVNLYVGLTGSSSGQNGRFASIVAEAYDEGSKNSFIRRLEMTQESFAKFAYWSNDESNTKGTIFFGGHDELWGPVWSNDTISINSDSATFHDQVGTAGVISGKGYGIFTKPPLEKQRRIDLPTTASLGVLAGYATAGGMNIPAKAGPNNIPTQLRDRIEFVAVDMDGDKDSTGADEGFYRRYVTTLVGDEDKLRGDWPGAKDAAGMPSSVPAASTVDLCGDWHYMPWDGSIPKAKLTAADTGLKFYPVSVHSQAWFNKQVKDGLVQRGGYTVPQAQAIADAEQKLGTSANTQPDSLLKLLNHPQARCYLAGDPHLVATDRVAGTPRGWPLGGNYTNADVQKGGYDTTFTPVGKYGSWVTSTVPTAAAVLLKRPNDAKFLTPIGHTYNPNGKGVIYVTGNVGISGVVNGQVTLYALGDIVILDDIRYANDPAAGVCHDILGLISGQDVVIADNALNTPVGLSTASGVNYGYRSMDETKDLFIHAVSMSLGTSFRVENHDKGPKNANDCGATQNGRGCIFLSGGIIQVSRGAVGTSLGYGFTKRYSYDRCAVRNPPPYFPTTGRFVDNRYLELDPVRFDPRQYFLALTPSGP